MASRSLASHRTSSSVMQVPTGTAVTEGLANLSRSMINNNNEYSTVHEETESLSTSTLPPSNSILVDNEDLLDHSELGILRTESVKDNHDIDNTNNSTSSSSSTIITNQFLDQEETTFHPNITNNNYNSKLNIQTPITSSNSVPRSTSPVLSTPNNSSLIHHTDSTLRAKDSTNSYSSSTSTSIHKSKLSSSSSSSYSIKDRQFDTEENQPLTFQDMDNMISNTRNNNILIRNPSLSSNNNNTTISSTPIHSTSSLSTPKPSSSIGQIPLPSSSSSSHSTTTSFFHRPLVYSIHILNNFWSYLGNTSYGQELQILLPLSLPIMIQSCLNQLLNIADLFFVGTVLGPEFLAAAALGNMFFNFLAALYMGAVSAIDESCSNAYSDKQYKLVNLYAQRGFFIMTLMAMIVMASMSSTEFFLTTVLRQEPDLSATAAGFVQALVLGTFPYVMSIGLSRYLWAQGIVWAPIVVDILANIVNVSLNAALIEVDGFLGAPLATSLSRALQLCMLVGYLYKWQPHIEKGTWDGWKLRTIIQDPKGLGTMTKAAFFGSFICIIESWPIEFSNVIAGYIDVPSLDAHTVVLNTCLFISLGVPLGMSVASSARIPLLLREGNKEGARRTAVVSVLATVSYNLCCAFLLLAGRWRMGRVFTTNLEVAEQCASVATVAALFQLVDGTQSTLSGILRGLGYSRLVTIITFLGYIMIGLPIGNYFAIHYAFGTTGLWIGLLCGVTSIMLCFMIIYTSVNWDKAVRKAQEQERYHQEQVRQQQIAQNNNTNTNYNNSIETNYSYNQKSGSKDIISKDIDMISPQDLHQNNPNNPSPDIPDIGGTGNGNGEGLLYTLGLSSSNSSSSESLSFMDDNNITNLNKENIAFSNQRNPHSNNKGNTTNQISRQRVVRNTNNTLINNNINTQENSSVNSTTWSGTMPISVR